MRYTFGSARFYRILALEEQKAFADSQPHYSIEYSNITDSLSGLFATKYLINYDSDTVPQFESWFTESLTIQNATSISSYASIKGMPLIYDIDRYGLRMHLEIIDFNPREVKDKEFKRIEDLEEINYLLYEKKIQDLFDAILL